MIYIIFTRDGFEQARDEVVANQATLWLNDDVLDEDEQQQWQTQGISINLLPQRVNTDSEKAVLAALAFVEKQVAKNEEIFIEYV